MPGLLFTGLPGLIAQFSLGLLLLLHNSQLMVHGTVKDLAGFTVAGYTRRSSSSSCRDWRLASSPGEPGSRGRAPSRPPVPDGDGAQDHPGLWPGVWLIVQLLPQPVAMLYTGDQDAELLAAAISSLTLNLAALPLEGIVMFGIVLLQAMARTRQALVISVAKTVLLLPLIFLLPLWVGATGCDGPARHRAAADAPLCWLLWREWRA